MSLLYYSTCNSLVDKLSDVCVLEDLASGVLSSGLTLSTK